MRASPNCECWISLFDGKTLGDWKPNEHPEDWTVQDGAIVVNGPRGHLFYMNKDNDFKNFHFRAEVKTKPNSNSGIYIHTQWLDEGWPEHGYESQVNVSQAIRSSRAASTIRSKSTRTTSKKSACATTSGGSRRSSSAAKGSS